jgi:D-glycero-alpha-D-manno-heptose 1-phosphate guanylyltransferase
MSRQIPMEMLILAGGYGTRLRSVVSEVPKPMAPVGGRPFLEYLLDYWIIQGVRRFIISTGYLGDIVQSHFGNDHRTATIEYTHELSPLGTGGALRLALKEITWSGKYALMANGDTWFPVDLTLMMGNAAQQNKPITVALKSMDKNDRYGGVKVSSNGTVQAFGAKSGGSPTLINAGCYLLEIAAVRQALENYSEAFSLEHDFLAPYAADGHVGSSIQDRPFLDIGVPEDYHRAFELLN